AEGHERGSCIDRGAGPIRDYMKQRCKELGLTDVRINAAGCLDRCELGPVMVIYPQGTWYRPTTHEEVDLIIAQHLQGGQVVAQLAIADPL
ncbi:MAG: hypothetical protein K2Q12_00830, partial [Rickettsiales bacterium]|nr:hypothetical protein [Rickettsiales bacterium]